MNEEIEYAEMLEIPISTVNVVQKRHRRRKQKIQEETLSAAEPTPAPIPEQSPLKDSVIAQVNDRLVEDESDFLSVEPDLLAESANSDGRLDFDPIPERIDTVRLYSTDETRGFWEDTLYPQDYQLSNENEGSRYAFKTFSKPEKWFKIALNAEFIAACVLCGAIFLTNVFMPNSAINTFFRAITNAPVVDADTRTHADFTLSPIVSELSGVELTLSPTGIVSFTDECCVYPVADGTVSDIIQNKNGTFTLKLSHSDSFTGVINGLDHVYYAVGEEVKANVPVGYTNGEGEVQVTMYSGGVLLNCLELTDENCLAWVEKAE